MKHIYQLFTWLMQTKLYENFHYLIHGDLEYKLHRLNQLSIATAYLHQSTFLPFKNKFAGQDIAIVACGPSLNDYHPIDNCIHIGVNRAYESKNVKLDFLFIVDNVFSPEKWREINTYRGDKCTKFYGLHVDTAPMNQYMIPESYAIDAKALRFQVDCDHFPSLRGYKPKLTFDISTNPLATFGSIVFPALQFALWTHPKRIFLVGCDCSEGDGHFNDKLSSLPASLIPQILKGYSALREFVTRYYPDTKIISVNPVGLKGQFNDWHQKLGPCP